MLPLDEERQPRNTRAAKPQRLPGEQTAVGLRARTRERANGFDVLRFGALGGVDNAFDCNSPGNKLWLRQRFELRKKETWCLPLRGINGNDLEILPAAERQQRVVGPTARMLTTEAGAYAGLVLHQFNSAGEIRHSENQMIHTYNPLNALPQSALLAQAARPSPTRFFMSSTTMSTIATVP